MKIAMAQINPTVGDLEGNLEKIKKFMMDAKRRDADVVAFPELAITGYPPQDLLLEKAFVKSNKKLLTKFVKENDVEMAGIIGFVDYKGKNLYNAAAVFVRNKLIGIAYKTLLPTYDVFDEDRYFKPASEGEIKPILMNFNGRKFRLGVEICEDLWDENYDIKVTDLLAKRGADIIVNVSASPFYAGKMFERVKLLKEKSRKNKVPIFYVNLVGARA
jgi:NAD+ synthase (glutamine-hydrolysing)